MEPLNTFFRISPSLLLKNVNSPQGSHTSSSFSSPSFAEHQTGLKVYRDSPPSFTSAHRVVDDNPLFEGFPALSVSKQGQGTTADCPKEDAGGLGESNQVQEHLHHLLNLLQQAHGDDGKTNGVALPHLADELEVVVKKLKQKEHGPEHVNEVQLEPGRCARMQAALPDADVYRATPTCSRTTASVANEGSSCWAAASNSDEPGGGSKPSESSFLWNMAASNNSSGDSGGTSITAASGRMVLRDSVCKQLLQSPASTVSPLSCVGPAVVACSPLFTVDDDCMASPKELPADRQRKRSMGLRASQHDKQQCCDPPVEASPQQSLFVAGSPALPATVTSTPEPPAPEGQQVPLYSWMQSMLASTPRQDMTDAPDGCPEADAASTSTSTPDSQQQAGEQQGDPLAAAVRAALAASPAEHLAYGSPLHLKIQRLLAQRQSSSPLDDAEVQADGAPRTTEEAQEDMRGADSAPVWITNPAAESPSTSQYTTDSTSSCTTPLTQGDITPMPFRSSVSPFGPTLRERYASKVASSAAQAALGAAIPQPATATTEPPSSASTSPTPSAIKFSENSPEAAELVAQLGLSLQLDPALVGRVSELDVLQHVEAWAREQHIASQAATSPEAEVGTTHAPGSGALLHVAIDTAVQTDPSPQSSGGQVAQAAKLAPETRDAAVCTAPVRWRDNTTFDNREPLGEIDECPTPDEDDDVGMAVFSPARSDQSKRSPAASLVKRYEASRFANKQSPAGTPGSATRRGAGRTSRAGKPHSSCDVTPVRRGLFRDADSARMAAMEAAAAATACHKAADQDGQGPSAEDVRPCAGTVEAPFNSGRGGGAVAAGPVMPQPRISDSGSPVVSDGVVEHPRQQDLPVRTSMPSAAEAPTQVAPKPAVLPPDQQPLAQSVGVGRGAGKAQNAPLVVQASLCTGRAQEAANVEVEAVPDVLFTPGNSLPGGSRSATSKHMSRIFPTSSANRTESSCGDSDSVCGVPRMLSSISSVSIITSERGAVGGTNG
ncbi:hypothetical protein Agub_g3244, partial [Astrephomene gubernaculifera]